MAWMFTFEIWKWVGAGRQRIGHTLLLVIVVYACSVDEQPSDGWNGSIDTLPSGQVVVRNTADPVWPEGAAWRVVEELRIGRVDGEGPDVFGRVADLEADATGRIYVLEAQANELRVFGPDGRHLVTTGRRGGGPGEFAQPVKLDWGPDGNLWVVDPSNSRISIFGPLGEFVRSLPYPGGFIFMPWPGRFDRLWRYYGPTPVNDGGYRMAVVRYDTMLTPEDTLEVPRDPVEREFFVLPNERGGRLRAGIPYTGSFRWQLSARGTIVAVLTDEYRFIEFGPEGDTLRTITREFDPLPVTAEDRDSAVIEMEWFTRQGGKIDLTKLPSSKPALQSFFWDDEDDLWVLPIVEWSRLYRVADVFDSTGRYLGEVELPFALATFPVPRIRNNVLYGVTTDELDVPFVVRARIEKPGPTAGSP